MLRKKELIDWSLAKIIQRDNLEIRLIFHNNDFYRYYISFFFFKSSHLEPNSLAIY